MMIQRSMGIHTAPLSIISASALSFDSGWKRLIVLIRRIRAKSLNPILRCIGFMVIF